MATTEGLILPPAIAPYQVVIVPVAAHKPGVLEKAEELRARLSKFVRVKLDDSENSPGWKFAQWEMKGVPLRLEIGPKDIENGQCVLVRRDNREKAFTKLEDLEAAVPALLDALGKSLYARAEQTAPGAPGRPRPWTRCWSAPEARTATSRPCGAAIWPARK